MPELLRQMHGLIPSHTNEFYFADANGELANVYIDSAGATRADAELVQLYFSEFHNRREREVALSFVQGMHTHYPTAVDDFNRRVLTVPVREFLHHDTYQLWRRPLDLFRVLQMKVTEHRRGLGTLHLCRGEKEADFLPRDYRLLEALTPFVAHALTPGNVDSPLIESDDRTLLVVSAAGAIEHYGVGAGRLLTMIAQPWMAPANGPRQGPMRLPEPVIRLCRSLIAVFEDRLPEAAPVWQCRNAWGQFEFRAYLLEPTATASSARIGVIITRFEPMALRLLRGARDLPLTARETRFCLLLAAGLPYAQIATRMDISEQTAVAHGRNVYAKLNVHNKIQLIEKLGGRVSTIQ